MTKTSRNLVADKLSPTYRFKRFLKYGDHVGTYKARAELLSRVKPVKEVCIIQTLPIGDGSPPSSKSVVKIDRSQTMWPFTVEFIEQVEQTTDLWVVIADAKRYQHKGLFDTEFDSSQELVQRRGVYSVDVAHVSRPAICLADLPAKNLDNPKILSCEEALDLEFSNPWQQLFRNAFLCSQNTGKLVKLIDCNILPQLPLAYNATFYHKEVAMLFAESVSAHLSRFAENDNQTE